MDDKTISIDDKTLDKYIEEWIGKREKDPKHFIICGGQRYYIGREDAPAQGRGFGGATFYIRFLDSGKVVRSTNLYYNGGVPERWKGRLPDTAAFIPAAEYEKMTDGNESADRKKEGRDMDDMDKDGAIGFCGLEAAAHPLTSGAFALKGAHFGAFGKKIRKYIAKAGEPGEGDKNFKPSVMEAYPENIEGITLNPWELEHPDGFWSVHEENGTLDSFVAIAKRIPEVRERLAAGEDLESLVRDPELGACARIYFDMGAADCVKVWLCDDFLVFQDNGRHRIIAARLAGQTIPVLVVKRTTLAWSPMR